jgi:hypothetical protein
MKRFLKTFALLIVSLFLVVSGVNTGLDHLSRSTALSNYTQYDDKGTLVLTYSGDLKQFKPSIKRAWASEFHYVPRS